MLISPLFGFSMLGVVLLASVPCIQHLQAHACLHVCMLGYVMLPHLPRRTDCLWGRWRPGCLGPGCLGILVLLSRLSPSLPLSDALLLRPPLLSYAIPCPLLRPSLFSYALLPFSLTPSLPSSLLHHSLSLLRPSLTPHLALLLPPCSFSSGFARETRQVGGGVSAGQGGQAAQPPAHGPLPRCPRRSGRQHALCEPLGRRDVNFVKRRRNRNMFRACTRAPRS